MPPARISLTLSRHFCLSFIASSRSSGLHPVSSHCCCMYVRAGRPAFAQPYVGVHRSTSLISSSLLLQQCPACPVHLTWIVFVMGGRWLYSWSLFITMIFKIVAWERVRKLLGFTSHWDRYIQSLASSCFFHRRLIEGLLLTLGVAEPLGEHPKRHSLLTADFVDWVLSPRSLGLKTSVVIYIFQTPMHASFWCPTYAIHIAFPLSFVSLKT